MLLTLRSQMRRLRIRVRPPALRPATPSNLTATAVGSSEIDLAWHDNSSNETGFLIERSLDSTAWSNLATVGAGVTAYADTGLTSGTRYYYRVSAFNAAESSPPSPVASAIPGPQITIDSAWLTANALTYGGDATLGPWLLSAANTRYVLALDVAASGTAFIFAAANQTLDLAGHTITYGNAAPFTVLNGGFEADGIGSATVTSWDLSGAPASTFVIAGNDSTDVFLFGSKVLKWSIPNGSAPQFIRSATLAIPTANRWYTAQLTPNVRSTGSSRNPALKIDIIDSVTGLPVTNYAQAPNNAGIGDSSYTQFMPTTTNPVYLKVTATLGSGSTTCSFYIDRVIVTASTDYGIVATSTSGDQLQEGNWTTLVGTAPRANANWPVAMRTLYAGCSGPVLTSSSGRGAIVQGAGMGQFCCAVKAQDTRGPIAISNIDFYNNGDDIYVVEARYTRAVLVASDTLTITNCTWDWLYPGPNVSVRSNTYSNINGIATLVARPTTITGCTFTHEPQAGVRIGGPQGAPAGTHLLSNCIWNHPQQIITNGYAIILSSGTRCLNNTITCDATEGTEGIYCPSPNNDIEIGGCTVDIYTRGNREYGTNQAARSLRVRDLTTTIGGVTGGPFTNINIHDSTFIARTGRTGYFTTAFGSRIDNLANNTHNVRFTNCVFKGIIDGPADPGAQYTTLGITLDSNYTSPESLIFTGCTFEANDVGLRLGGNDTGQGESVWNEIFRDCTVKKSADGVTTRPFTSWHFGSGQNQTIGPGVGFYGTIYAGGATSAITWDTGSSTKAVGFGWEVVVNVKDGSAAPIAGATVTLTDSHTVVTNTGTTDANGNAAFDVAVISYSDASNILTTVTHPPFALAVTAPGHSYTPSSITPTQDTTYNVVMS